VFGEGVLGFLLLGLGLVVFNRSSGQFGDRDYAWQPWARGELGAHISAWYARPPAVAEPSTPSPAPSTIRRLFGRCVRRRVDANSQLVIFVNQTDLRRLAGSGLRSDQEAANAFARWYNRVDRTRRYGTREHPSVAVDIEGVEVAWRDE
jgi:hypothetical protein